MPNNQLIASGHIKKITPIGDHSLLIVIKVDNNMNQYITFTASLDLFAGYNLFTDYFLKQEDFIMFRGHIENLEGTMKMVCVADKILKRGETHVTS